MTIQRIMIGGFLVLLLVFAALIFKLVTDDKKNWVTEKSTHSKIMDIYGGDSSRTKLQMMELSDGQKFKIPQNLMGKVSVGDSVFKEKGQNFYRFKPVQTKD
jgi:hypothetical protein